MKKQTNNFIIKNIKYKYIISKEMSFHAPEPVRGGIQSADICCKSCSHEFNESNFHLRLGGFIAICEKCSNMENIDYSRLH